MRSSHWAVSGKGKALLTEAIEIGTERLVSEVLLPEPRREEMDFKGRMGIDALQRVKKIRGADEPYTAAAAVGCAFLARRLPGSPGFFQTPGQALVGAVA